MVASYCVEPKANHNSALAGKFLGTKYVPTYWWGENERALLSPDGLVLQSVGVSGIHCEHHAAHGDVLLLGHCHGVRVEHGAFIDVLHCDLHGGCGAGAIGNVWDQRVFVFHFDQQRVEG